MKMITSLLEHIQIQSPISCENLHIFPLINEHAAADDYDVLDDALRYDEVQLTEATTLGRVPEIKLVSNSSRPVFLLDGLELLGAMQDRVLNISILASAGSTITIPVSCVEAARWDPSSEHFGVSKQLHFASARAERTSQVTEALRSEGSPHGDQVEIWAAIEERASALGVECPTRAHSALFSLNEPRLKRFANHFAAQPQQTGALIAIGRDVVGFDLFDSHKTVASLLPKLIRSAALDALVSDHGRIPSLSDAQQFVHRAAKARTLRFAAVGLGEDIRLCGDGISGGALVAKGRVIHLSAFATANA